MTIYADRVPVKMKGVFVGYARVGSDGTIEAKIREQEPTEFLKAVQQGLVYELNLDFSAEGYIPGDAAAPDPGA